MNNQDYNKKAIFISCVIISTALLLLFSSYKVFQERVGRIAGDFFYPYLRLVRVTTDAGSGQSLLGLSHAELAAKVEHLERLNRQLALQAANAAELYQENEELRNRLKIEVKPYWQVIVGEIILRDPALWRERFFLNIGEDKGVKKGCAVFDLDSNNNPILVGIIGSVRKKSSEVITIFNPEFRFSAKVGSNDNIGFVNTGDRKNYHNKMSIDLLPITFDALPGTALRTTGYESNIPGGLKIGEIISIDKEDKLYALASSVSGWFKPSINPDRMRFLMVAIRKDNGATKK
jgi:rod shape-determining protein MreC